MHEKDYRKLYECEFPPMERLITEKDIFKARMYDKPIMVHTTHATKEQREEMLDTLWRTGVYRPRSLDDWEADMHMMNAVVTHCVRERYFVPGRGGNTYHTKRAGDTFRISYDEWKKRYDDWVTRINK